MLKKVIGKIHLWLGFASGLVVFILSITGCILAFQQEIEDYIYPFKNIQPFSNKHYLPPTKLKSIAQSKLPGRQANSIVYNGTDKSAMVYFYGGNPEYYFIAFINPYTGRLLSIEDIEKSFFHFILHGHYYLWLPEKIGKIIVSSATLIFFSLLITGIFLWFPRRKGAVKQRFTINFKARWRRKNYDLHNVLGFYILLVGLSFAVTGLVMGFEWFSKSFYFITSGGNTFYDYNEPKSDTAKINFSEKLHNPVDIIWQKYIQTLPQDAGILVSFPHSDNQPIDVFINRKPGTYYKVDYHFYDQHTLKKLTAKGTYSGKYQDAGFADKLRRMNYDIHVGAILGFAGKVLVFCVSLICASLPVTGFLIWLGRRKKAKLHSSGF